MSYQGYLIKLNTTILPMRFMALKSYTITPNQRMDLDSYRDANGVLHREVLGHTATKIEWATPAMLKNGDIAELNALFKANFENSIERRISATYYDMETDSYKSGTFYMPDVQYTIYRTDSKRNELYYNAARFALIEY